jgi:hypothetical protein
MSGLARGIRSGKRIVPEQRLPNLRIAISEKLAELLQEFPLTYSL